MVVSIMLQFKDMKENSGQFKKGQSSWNKDKKGIMKPNKTSFKKGLITWNKGTKGVQISTRKGIKQRPHSEETKKKMSKTHIGLLKGIPKSEEHKKNLSISHMGKKLSDETKQKLSGKNSTNWKGGITPITQRIRHSIKSQQWREKVFNRDNYTCQKCGKKCSNKLGPDYIQCHHKEPWRKTKNNDMTNLITLCLSCHVKEDFNYNKNCRDLIQAGGF